MPKYEWVDPIDSLTGQFTNENLFQPVDDKPGVFRHRGQVGLLCTVTDAETLKKSDSLRFYSLSDLLAKATILERRKATGFSNDAKYTWNGGLVGTARARGLIPPAR